MAGYAPGLIRAAAAELAPAIARSAVAAAGAAAGAWALVTGHEPSRDEAQEAAPVLALPRTRSCDDCPPAVEGHAERKSRKGVPDVSLDYQGRITGREYSLKDHWSEEWIWRGIDFDGFQPAECLMQEAKARYDQFFLASGEPKWFFQGFKAMRRQARRQAEVVSANLPTRLLWYFMTPRMWKYMAPFLDRLGVPSILSP